jgi:hypothetical protein
MRIEATNPAIVHQKNGGGGRHDSPALAFAHRLALAVDGKEASDLAARDAVVEHVVAVVALDDAIEAVAHGGLLRREDQLGGCLPRWHRALEHVAPGSILCELCGLVVEAEAVEEHLGIRALLEHAVGQRDVALREDLLVRTQEAGVLDDAPSVQLLLDDCSATKRGAES